MSFLNLKKNSLFLAPMESFNDFAFRYLCKKNGADVVYTQMISAAALSRTNNATIKLIDYQDYNLETPVGIQLFGQNKENILKSVEIIESGEVGKFDFIDLNLGCPTKKILSQGSGFALSRRRNKTYEILKSMVEISKLPITAKIRIGEDSNKLFGIELAKKIEDTGVSLLGVHGRTLVQGYSGKADWDYISQIKQSVSIPIVGNGDITTPEFAEKVVDKVDHLMIAREALTNPTIFQQIKDYFKKKEYQSFDLKQHKKIISDYLELATKYKTQEKFIKLHLVQFLKGFPGALKLRAEVAREKDLDKIKEKINNFLKTH